MRMRDFIKENREEIDAVIKRECPDCRMSDHERELWIRNWESLYNWARRSGVKI